MKTKTYNGFIFDLDGTLLDSRVDIVKATNETISKMGGKPLDEDVIASYVGMGVRPLMKKALENVKDLDPKIVQEYFSEYYIAHCTDASQFYKGVDELLTHLKHHQKTIAILTNKPQRYTDVILKNLNKIHWFDFVLGAEAGYPSKPDPSGLKAILKKFQLSKENILYVGDTEVDFKTAKNMGCDVALFTGGFTAKQNLIEFSKSEFCFLFDDFQSLYDYV